VISPGALVQQRVEVAMMIQDRHDPDFALLDTVDDAVRRCDDLPVGADPADAQLWNHPSSVCELAEGFDRRVESFIERERGVDVSFTAPS